MPITPNLVERTAVHLNLVPGVLLGADQHAITGRAAELQDARGGDQICRMHVSSDSAVARIRNGAVEHYFCSFPCLRTFVLERFPADNPSKTIEEDS